MSGRKKVSFVVVSGINFPFRSRQYLLNLVGEIAKREDAKFLVVAGHTLAGKELERELKQRIQDGLVDVSREERDKVREEVTDGFVQEIAQSFSEFLPKVGINWHMQLAERVYDRPIGRAILERLRDIRDDVRLIDDPEAKIPIQLTSFGEVRSLVPRKTPWFYENVTGLMQRLINSFAMRTYSPRPALILAGCTGTGVFIPGYKGVPSIAVPVLHKLDEQQSTENMVGCVVVNLLPDDGTYRVVPEFYDFRTAIFKERQIGISKLDLTGNERAVLDALVPGSASFKTLSFRINSGPPRAGLTGGQWSPKKVEKYTKQLVGRHLIDYNRRSNRYAISEKLAERASISLEEFLRDRREVVTVSKSCWHVGAMKGLYATVQEQEPKLGLDADAIILNGDVIQGISHNYEYNGELILNGPDKHQIAAAKMQAAILLEIFKKRFAKYGRTIKDVEVLLEVVTCRYDPAAVAVDEGRQVGGDHASIFECNVRPFLEVAEP